MKNYIHLGKSENLFILHYSLLLFKMQKKFRKVLLFDSDVNAMFNNSAYVVVPLFYCLDSSQMYFLTF